MSTQPPAIGFMIPVNQQDFLTIKRRPRTPATYVQPRAKEQSGRRGIPVKTSSSPTPSRQSRHALTTM